MGLGGTHMKLLPGEDELKELTDAELQSMERAARNEALRQNAKARAINAILVRRDIAMFDREVARAKRNAKGGRR